MTTPIQVKKLKGFLVTYQKAKKVYQDFKDTLVDSCTHPTEFVSDSYWWHDNGYGKLKKLPMKLCSICNSTQAWPEMSSAWTKPKENSDD